MSSSVLEIFDQLDEKKSELIQNLKKDLDIREAQIKERFNKEIRDKIFIIKKNFKVKYTNQ